MFAGGLATSLLFSAAILMAPQDRARANETVALSSSPQVQEMIATCYSTILKDFVTRLEFLGYLEDTDPKELKDLVESALDELFLVSLSTAEFATGKKYKLYSSVWEMVATAKLEEWGQAQTGVPSLNLRAFLYKITERHQNSKQCQPVWAMQELWPALSEIHTSEGHLGQGSNLSS